MPRSSGTFSLPAGNPVVTGTVISTTWANNTLNDISNEITNSLPRDGTAPPLANIPFGNYKITGLGAATLPTDAAQYQQVQSGATNYLTAVAGTNAITANLSSPTLTAYAAGNTFRFTSTGTNTGATTVNINGLGAKTVNKDGSALVAGDITSGRTYELIYDGTNFSLISGGSIPDASITTAKIADSAVTNAKLAFDGGALGYRNAVIGGNFTTNPWQRGTTFTGAADATYSADRFQYSFNTSSVVNILKTADAPTAAQADVFSQHSLHIDVTTADAAIAATDFCLITQKIEGINSASFGFGQAGTRYVTLSFWHKHTKTGIYCVSLVNSATDRSYVAEYTQAVTDTWEKSEITIPVDTSGTWLYDTGIGIRISFALAIGSNFHTTANTWAAGNFLSTSNQVNALDNVANNFKIQLVQLESGQVATPFENRTTGEELQLCQRYYEKTFDLSVTPAANAGLNGSISTTSGAALANASVATYAYKAVKRATPTITTFNPSAAGTDWRDTNSNTNVAATAENIGTANAAIAISGTPVASRKHSIHATVSAEL